MATRNGTDIKIEVDGNFIARATEGSISFSTNVLNATNKDSGGDREILPGERSFVLTSSAFLDFSATFGFEGMYDAWVNRTKVSVDWKDTNAGGLSISGSGYITEFEGTAPSEDLATISATIEGTASTTKATT